LIELNENNSTTKGNICENNTFLSKVFPNVAIANVCRANLPTDHLYITKDLNLMTIISLYKIIDFFAGKLANRMCVPYGLINMAFQND
jgi:hypothetical protein